MSLGVVGTDDPQSLQVLPGGAVDPVHQPLDALHVGEVQFHEQDYDDDQEHHRQGGHDRPFECSRIDLAYGPDRHYGRLHRYLESSGHELLYVVDIVGGPGDQAGGRERIDILLGEGLHPVELQSPEVPAEVRGGLGTHRTST